VFINQGARRFAEFRSSGPLLRGHFNSLIPIDLNNDGFIDLVGQYQTDSYAGVHKFWGTTFFLNDGTGAFQVVDGKDIVGIATAPSNGERWNIGAFVPTVVNTRVTEGVVFEPVGGCGSVTCTAGLNLYKLSANGALGTGPDFADSASLGVPGFNESYYLRHYPDAAAAVRAGDFKTGLAHYRAIGAAKGYRPHALTSAILPGNSLRSDDRRYRLTYQGDGNVVLSDERAGTAIWATSTGGTTPGRFAMQGDGRQPRDLQRDRRVDLGSQPESLGTTGLRLGLVRGDLHCRSSPRIVSPAPHCCRNRATPTVVAATAYRDGVAHDRRLYPATSHVSSGL
jgi:hypothetical protein